MHESSVFISKSCVVMWCSFALLIRFIVMERKLSTNEPSEEKKAKRTTHPTHLGYREIDG